MTDLEIKLKKDIIMSGLPTEIQVTNLLRQDNWIVINQYPFDDQRSQKIRTLDILAGKLIKNGKLCILYIECKKNTDHPWVFYTSGGFEENLSLLIRTLEGIARQALQKEIKDKRPSYSIHPNYFSNQNIGLISYIPFGKKDDFHVARSQLLSAIESRRLATNEDIMIYPLIIFDGDIYEISSKVDSITPSKTDYIIFLSAMISEVTPILIDVVTLNSFASYLKRLNEELGPSYSYAELQESIEKGIKKLQEFFQAITRTANILQDATKEFEKTNH